MNLCVFLVLLYTCNAGVVILSGESGKRVSSACVGVCESQTFTRKALLLANEQSTYPESNLAVAILGLRRDFGNRTTSKVYAYFHTCLEQQLLCNYYHNASEVSDYLHEVSIMNARPRVIVIDPTDIHYYDLSCSGTTTHAGNWTFKISIPFSTALEVMVTFEVPAGTSGEEFVSRLTEAFKDLQSLQDRYCTFRGEDIFQMRCPMFTTWGNLKFEVSFDSSSSILARFSFTTNGLSCYGTYENIFDNNIEDLSSVLSEHATTLYKYVQDGGSIFQRAADFGWVERFSNLTTTAGDSGRAYRGKDYELSKEADALFPGLIHQDPYDGGNSSFTWYTTRMSIHWELGNVEATNFAPILTNEEGFGTVVISRGVFEAQSALSLNCSGATTVAGQWSFSIPNIFDGEVTMQEGVTGEEFESELTDLFKTSQSLQGMNCSIPRGNIFQVGCSRNNVDFAVSTAVVDFGGDSGSFNSGFDINGVSCHVPACEFNCEDVTDTVCDQTGISYKSPCYFEFNACRFVNLGLEIAPCPVPTPVPTLMPREPGEVCDDALVCREGLVCGQNNCDLDIYGFEDRCCAELCAYHDAWDSETSLYNSSCCGADTSACVAHEGGCTSDDHCVGSLVCGDENCDPELYPAGARCCVARCADYTEPGWDVNDAATCCTASRPCPNKAGSCTDDSSCDGNLVCGNADSCADAYNGAAGVNCCEVPCRDHNLPGWLYRESCCTADSPCPVHTGGCTNSSQCAGDLVCGDIGSSCPAGYPVGSRCCRVPCQEFEEDDWVYDPTCCTSETPCQVNAGGCSEDGDCDGSLICGEGSCGEGYPGNASCCVASCADHEAEGWTYDSSCCSNENQCNENEGNCGSDEHCSGHLVCGDEGTSCPEDYAFPATANCCQVSCAIHTATNWQFDASCCDLNEQGPCPANEGGCIVGNDEQCGAGLVCEAGSCDLDFFSKSAGCCVSQCAAVDQGSWNASDAVGCCTDDAKCPLNVGSCDTSNQCDGTLVCAEPGTGCNPEIYGEETTCCIQACANIHADGFDVQPNEAASCCSEDAPCPAGAGTCANDDQCYGDHIVCGSGNCDTTLGFDTESDCCMVSCAAHNVRGWEFDAGCCTGEGSGVCGAHEGGCTATNQCDTGLECGAGLCDPHFFDEEASCCVPSCADYMNTNWLRDDAETCCTDASPCPLTSGHCSDDSQCVGDLVCGTNNCDTLYYGPGKNCCQVSCSNHEIPTWQYDPACCTEESPCPVNEGSCSSNDQCADDLVCGAPGVSCDPNVFPIDARCCVAECAAFNTDDLNSGPSCCTAEGAAACPQGGICDDNDDCVGSLVCGGTIRCDESVFGVTDETCCQVSCATHNVAGWQYDANCCGSAPGEQCGMHEGGCADDSQCAPGLVCGVNNCDPHLFPDGANCCVAPCAEPTDAAWTFEEQCCDDSACPIGVGDCASDDQCDGDLVCGKAGGCSAPQFDTSVRCCQVSCRDPDTRAWAFDPECCTADDPCGVGIGGCSADADCVDDLVCGECDVNDPDNPEARCCATLVPTPNPTPAPTTDIDTSTTQATPSPDAGATPTPDSGGGVVFTPSPARSLAVDATSSDIEVWMLVLIVLGSLCLCCCTCLVCCIIWRRRKDEEESREYRRPSYDDSAEYSDSNFDDGGGSVLSYDDDDDEEHQALHKGEGYLPPDGDFYMQQQQAQAQHHDDVEMVQHAEDDGGNQYGYAHNAQLTPSSVGGGITPGETPTAAATNQRSVHPIAEHGTYANYGQEMKDGENYDYTTPTGWEETPTPTQAPDAQNFEPNARNTQVSRTNTTLLDAPNTEFDSVDPEELSKSYGGERPAANSGGGGYAPPVPMSTGASYHQPQQTFSGRSYQQPTPMTMSRSVQQQQPQQQQHMHSPHLSPAQSMAREYQQSAFEQQQPQYNGGGGHAQVPEDIPTGRSQRPLHSAPPLPPTGAYAEQPYAAGQPHEYNDPQQQTTWGNVGQAAMTLGAGALSAAGAAVGAAAGIVTAAASNAASTRHAAGERTYTDDDTDAGGHTRESSHTRGTYSDSRAL